MTSNRRLTWIVCAVALIAFAAGSLMTKVSADSNRVFELRVYHVVPGKLPALEARFRDTASKLLAKHDLKVIGYWVPENAPAFENTFVYVIAHASRDDAKKNWDAMFADPEFQAMMKSERADKAVERVDVAYMRPTDFSALK